MAGTTPTTGTPAQTTPPHARGPLPMTPGRLAALVIGVPVCLALVVTSGFSNLANFAEGRSPVSYAAPAGTTALTVNTSGNLTIRQVPAGSATLTGTARYTFARGTLSTGRAGSAATVGYHCPFPFGDCALDARLTVPASVTALTTRSGSGDATVTGFTGPLDLSTGSGNLTAGSVGSLSSPLTLNTGSGTIQASTVTSGRLSASSGSGDIKATGATAKTVILNTDSGNVEVSTVVASGRLSASTGSGDIRASGVRSATIDANTNSGLINELGITAITVTASSGNGDIDITFTGVPRNVHVNSDSGSIRLILPPGNTRYHVTASTDNGTVNDAAIPKSSASPNVITATTGNGNVTITRQQ